MNFDEFQRKTATTAIYPGAGDEDSVIGLCYTAMGLGGEAGELLNKIKKVLRDDNGVIGDMVRAKLADELGDTLYYVSQLAAQLGVKLSAVAEGNLAKLASRAARGVLHGSGDTR